MNIIKMECNCSEKGKNKKMGRQKTDWDKTFCEILLHQNFYLKFK